MVSQGRGKVGGRRCDAIAWNLGVVGGLLAYGFGAIAGVWIAFFTWIYVYDIPNGPIFWAMAGIFTMIIAYRAEMPLWDI